VARGVRSGLARFVDRVVVVVRVVVVNRCVVALWVDSSLVPLAVVGFVVVALAVVARVETVFASAEAVLTSVVPALVLEAGWLVAVRLIVTLCVPVVPDPATVVEAAFKVVEGALGVVLLDCCTATV
jgi:hypothetical protein